MKDVSGVRGTDGSPGHLSGAFGCTKARAQGHEDTRTQGGFLSPDMVRAFYYALKSLRLSAQYSERRYSPPRLVLVAIARVFKKRKDYSGANAVNEEDPERGGGGGGGFICILMRDPGRPLLN